MVDRLLRFIRCAGVATETASSLRSRTAGSLDERCRAAGLSATETPTTVDEGVGVTRASPDNWAFLAARAVIHARRVSGGAAGFDRSGEWRT